MNFKFTLVEMGRNLRAVVAQQELVNRVWQLVIDLVLELMVMVHCRVEDLMVHLDLLRCRERL
jgi:hypothetical protein